MSTVVAEKTTHQVREGAFGNATGLACRECGHRITLGPNYACPECFGPLEIAYDFPAVTREQIEAGPRTDWPPSCASCRGCSGAKGPRTRSSR